MKTWLSSQPCFLIVALASVGMTACDSVNPSGPQAADSDAVMRALASPSAESPGDRAPVVTSPRGADIRLETLLPTSDWYSDLGFCYGPTSRLLTGDFNGDGHADLLCQESTTGERWIVYANSDGSFTKGVIGWHDPPGRWCAGGQQVFVGDINGDGRADMLCHNPTTGEKWLAYADGAGKFPASGSSWYWDSGWCAGVNHRLFVADFNGDDRVDLLCHDAKTGEKWVTYADSRGMFSGTGSYVAAGVWACADDSQLFIGDANGDKRADLLCHDPKNGRLWIAYSGATTLVSSTWFSSLRFCAGQRIYIGDFNEDGRADMLCHTPATGEMWVLNARSNGSFVRSGIYSDVGVWCNSRQQLFVGDFNGDRSVDLLCHDPVTGEKWLNRDPF